MTILAVDTTRGVFDHRCPAPGCGLIRRGLRLDPAKGDLTLWLGIDGEVEALCVRPCPLCASTTSLSPFVPAWEAQETDPATGRPQTQPGALTGRTFAETRAVVVEHHHGYLPEPEHTRQAQFLRTMQRHPDLAPHAPLVELRPARYAQLIAQYQRAARAAAADGGVITLPGEEQPPATVTAAVTASATPASHRPTDTPAG